MSFTECFCGKLKTYQEVIIYGYADIGVCVLDYIIDLETSIKIANYSGRVKYFATSDKAVRSARKEKKGIRIKSIYDLKAYAKQALVIVATQEQHHGPITKILDELSFDHRLYIRHEDYCMLREAIENHRGIINTRIGQYHLNHQMKLDRLRRKVCRGERVRVFFITHDAAVFGAASVYRAMEKDTLFEPFIYVVSRRDVSYQDFYNDVRKDVDFFTGRGYRVICGYDEFQNPKDLHTYRPDLIFYDIPKLHGSAGGFYNRLDMLNWEYLTCYIPYSFLMVDSFYYHYHTTCIRETWRFFLDATDNFKRVLADGDFNGFNTVLSGYPKFDDYFDREGQLPAKIDNGRPTVIYAPHHSLGGVSNNFATFDLYGRLILEFAREHPEINFVLKPHPLLPFQIETRYRERKISFSPEDYGSYLDEVDRLPNAVCVTDGDYIGLFKKSTCMITDCGSFIGEYFPSGNPCIYLFNPRKKNQEEVYTPLALKILSSYYVAKEKEELEGMLQSVILDGNDVKRIERENLFAAEFRNIGHAGAFICEYLKNELKDAAPAEVEE